MSLHFNQLLDTVKQFPFVLFVGAGINGTLCKRWNELLNYLRDHAYQFIQKGRTKKSFDEYCNTLPIETQAELYKLILGSHYTLFLKKAIYETFSRCQLEKYIHVQKGDDDKYQYLYHIAQLSQHPSVVSILSLNYDNFLELAISNLNQKKPKRKPHSMPGGCKWQSSDTNSFVPVYHIHGFLPYPTSDMPMDSEDVVLSQDEYISTIQDTSSIANSTAIFHLTNYPTLFLGLSMKDWNILRFLKTSLDNGRSFFHYCIDAQDENTAALKSTLMDAYKVKMILFGNKDYKSVRGAVEKIAVNLSSVISKEK